jgi:hypothetical protein
MLFLKNKKINMKKIILLIFSSVVYAQNNNVTYGISAGINNSWANIDYNINKSIDYDFGGTGVDNKTFNYSIGIFLNYKLNNKVSFQPEIKYSKLAFSTNYYSGKNNEIQRWQNFYNLNYIRIPLNVNYGISKKINLFLGPEFGVLLIDKRGYDGYIKYASGNIRNFSYITKGSFLHSYIFNTIDFGLNGGLSYSIFSKTNIGLKYYLGIIDIRRSNPNNNTVKINYAELTIGYKLN